MFDSTLIEIGLPSVTWTVPKGVVKKHRIQLTGKYMKASRANAQWTFPRLNGLFHVKHIHTQRPFRLSPHTSFRCRAFEGLLGSGNLLVNVLLLNLGSLLANVLRLNFGSLLANVLRLNLGGLLGREPSRQRPSSQPW